MISFRMTVMKWAVIKQSIVLFTLAIVVAIVVPNYWTQAWTWNHLPELAQVKQLKQIQQQGLALKGWQTLNQRSIKIGGHSWSAQAMRSTFPTEAIMPEAEAALATPQTTTLLLLRPQTWIRDLPQVDWMDINGLQQWKTDSARSIEFRVTGSNGQSIPVKARFLRGWTKERTYAVMQWYAWSTGGSPSPTNWFWANQITQWKTEQPLAWIAVSVMQPIAPLGNIETVRLPLETLAQQIQTALTETALQPSP